MEYKSLQDAAAEIARVVGARLREVLNSPDTFEVNFKGARDLVTEFDVWAEDQIREFLLKRFPEHQIIGEETSAELQGTVGATLETIAADSLSWCIDPIDGTTNFVSSIPHVGISIGFLEKGVAKAGVVYDPCRDELFSASFGGGASVNSHRIKPANNPEMINAVIATGFTIKQRPGNAAEMYFRQCSRKCAECADSEPRRLTAAGPHADDLTAFTNLACPPGTYLLQRLSLRRQAAR